MSTRRSGRSPKKFHGERLPQIFIGETREVLDPNVETGDRIGHQRQMTEYHERVHRKTAIVGKNFLQVLAHYGLGDSV